MGFLRQEYWSGLPCSAPGDLPDPGTELVSLVSPVLAGRFIADALSVAVAAVLLTLQVRKLRRMEHDLHFKA